VLEEVVPRFAPAEVESLRAAHEDFIAGLAARSAQQMATANFLFVQHIAEQSHNAVLQRSLVSVVHIIRLGSLHLPEYVDVESISRAQQLLITACAERDPDVAREAMGVLRSIRIPQR
jgi:DNA-binding GntR family transcriptional regulator